MQKERLIDANALAESDMAKSECYRKSAIQELYCPNCGAKMYQTGGTISKELFAEIGCADNE